VREIKSLDRGGDMSRCSLLQKLGHLVFSAHR
jgi:hypothetical protein